MRKRERIESGVLDERAELMTLSLVGESYDQCEPGKRTKRESWEVGTQKIEGGGEEMDFCLRSELLLVRDSIQSVQR